MFLSMAELFHEPVWAKWFQEAEGLVPYASLYNKDCQDLALNSTGRHCCCEAKERDPISARLHQQTRLTGNTMYCMQRAQPAVLMTQLLQQQSRQKLCTGSSSSMCMYTQLQTSQVSHSTPWRAASGSHLAIHPADQRRPTSR